MDEYDTGMRTNRKGSDRFAQTLLPVLRESAWSLRKQGAVDVVLITHYDIKERHWKLLNDALNKPPVSSGFRSAITIPFQIWPNATPLAYKYPKPANPNRTGQKLVYHTSGLSRQHRFVIKDKWQHYDMFVVFEDDMLIHEQHIQQYWKLTQHLYQLRWKASHNSQDSNVLFYGNLTFEMLQRIIPGFFRVEAALPGWNRSAMTHYQDNLYPQISMDWSWKGSAKVVLDPSPCCHVWNETANEHIPRAPSISDLYFWETSIEALAVRLLPGDDTQDNHATYDDLDWVLLLAGSLDWLGCENAIGDFWVGQKNLQENYFASKPDPLKARYSNNQGGWIATRRQILEWHSQMCTRSGFLPPFPNELIGSDSRRRMMNSQPEDNFHGPFLHDGLGLHPVEYWSGGVQLFGPSCNLKRIIPMEPKQFSRHLLYHSSNNKQRQDNVLHKFSSYNIAQLWAQINAARKRAMSFIPNQQKKT